MNWVDFEDECGHTWASRAEETVTYANQDGSTFTEPARGPHVCIKGHSHVDDITNDDHKCCCGATLWEDE